MAVYTFIILSIYVSGLFVAGIAENKQGCRNVSYNVQNLHQTNTCCESKTSGKNAVLDVLRFQFAQLQAKVDESHTSLYRELQTVKGQLEALKELSTSCPANYTWTFGNSCYKFVSEKKNWFEASKSCKADGAKLVAMETANENAFLQNYIKSSNHLKNAVIGYWTAGNDIATEGTWVWTSDETNTQNVAYSDWRKNEPNGKTVENCLMLLTPAYQWIDVTCSRVIRYICEKRIRST